MDGIVERYVFSSSILRHSRLTAFDWTLMIATRSDKLEGNYRSCTARVKRGNQGAFFSAHSLIHFLHFLDNHSFLLAALKWGHSCFLFSSIQVVYVSER